MGGGRWVGRKAGRLIDGLVGSGWAGVLVGCWAGEQTGARMGVFFFFGVVVVRRLFLIVSSVFCFSLHMLEWKHVCPKHYRRARGTESTLRDALAQSFRRLLSRAKLGPIVNCSALIPDELQILFERPA